MIILKWKVHAFISQKFMALNIEYELYDTEV